MTPEAMEMVLAGVLAGITGGGATGLVLRTKIEHLQQTATRIEAAVARAHARLDDHERRVTRIEVQREFEKEQGR